MVQRIALIVQFEEGPLDVGIGPAVLVPIEGEGDLACREDVVSVEAVLLQSWIGKLDEPESASGLSFWATRSASLHMSLKSSKRERRSEEAEYLNWIALTDRMASYVLST